jgi:peptidoglycan/xylan/chitin deacetylase (PgdA/CDA1 family)
MRRRTVLGAVPAMLAGCSAPPTGARPGASPSSPSPSASRASPAVADGLPAEIVNGPRDAPRVALTFHGQGEPALVKRLLAELGSGGARVTVLAVGSWLDAQPDLARLVLDGGHELGNHTQNHLAIADLGADRVLAEIQGCADRLARLTGSIGAWFRPSQTQHATPLIEAQAAKVGYRTCLSYDVDSLDFTDPGAAAVVRNTLRSVRNGSVVSLHFGHAGTVEAMPALLDGLRRRGLAAVTMTELMR